MPRAMFGSAIIAWTWTRLLSTHHASLEMFPTDTHRKLWRRLLDAVVLRRDPVVLSVSVCRTRLDLFRRQNRIDMQRLHPLSRLTELAALDRVISSAESASLLRDHVD